MKSAVPKAVLRFARELASERDWSGRVVAWETLASHDGAMRWLNDELAEEMAQASRTGAQSIFWP